MSKTMKKLICALLSSTMLLSSVGLVGFASEEAPAATEAPAADTAEAPAEEAAEAPAEEAAEAPAEGADTTQTAPGPAVNVDNSAYDNDDYYRRALDMAAGLGIITGYEDGSVQPGSPVTRAEMASIILRMLGISATGSYRGAYTDVADNHWAAKQIQAATDQGIINGMGDGTFQPDGSVTYEQVCVMLVRALNYGEEAIQYGGWPNGYLNIASGVLDITDSAEGQVGVAAERGLVIKMVYNALIGPYKEQKGFGALGQPEYNTSKTLADARFDVKKGKGVLKATATTSIINSKLLTNQVLIDVEDDSNDDDEGTLYETALTNIDDYVGSNITYYYQDRASSAETVLTVFSTGSRTKTEELNIDDIEEIRGFGAADTDEPAIKMYGSSSLKKFDTDTEPTIVYNGQTITNSDLELAQANDTTAGGKHNDARLWDFKDIDGDYEISDDENKAAKAVDMNKFLKPKMGSVKLIDTNSNGKYETIVVEKYEQMVISAATASSLSGKINGVSTRFTKLDDPEKVVTVSRDGDTVRVRNLKTNDVASVKSDLNNEVIDIVVTAESFEGKINSKGTAKGDDDVLITIDGTKYPVDMNALADVKVGQNCMFYTDSFGRIGYIETVSATGMLASGEAYGWIMSVYESEDRENTMIKMMTQDGIVEYTIADNVSLWLPDATAKDVDKSGAKIEDGAAAVKAAHGIQADGNITVNKATYLRLGGGNTGNNTPIRLVKYKSNSSSEISMLYYAVDSTKVSEESAVRVYPTNLYKTASMGSVIKNTGYTVPDGMLELTVPMDYKEMGQTSSYAFGSVNPSVYLVRENGSDRNFVLGEFSDDVTPSILINFAPSSSAAETFDHLNTATGGPSAMVLDTIDEGYDDDDNQVYTLNGFISGSETSLKTNKNTNIGWFDQSSAYASGGRTFNVTSKWTEDSTDSALDYLTQGDLLLYEGDGRVVARYVGVDELSKYAEALDAYNGEGDAPKYPGPMGAMFGTSDARVSLFLGRVTEYDAEAAWVKIDDLSPIVFDPAKTIDIVQVTGSRVTVNPEGAGTAADLEVGDFIYISTANKGDINNIVVYKFD